MQQGKPRYHDPPDPFFCPCWMCTFEFDSRNGPAAAVVESSSVIHTHQLSAVVTDWGQLPIPNVTLGGCLSLPPDSGCLHRGHRGGKYRYRFHIVTGWVLDYVPIVRNVNAGEFIVDCEPKLPHMTNIPSSECRVIGTTVGVRRLNRLH